MRNVMLVKLKKKTVGHPASHLLLSYCNLVPVKKIQFYLTLCCVSVLKTKLPVMCCLKFIPAEKLGFMKHPFLPRKTSYSMLKLLKLKFQSIPRCLNKGGFHFRFNWSFFQITKIPFSILNKRAGYFVPKNYDSNFRVWPTATQSIGQALTASLPWDFAEWCSGAAGPPAMPGNASNPGLGQPCKDALLEG